MCSMFDSTLCDRARSMVVSKKEGVRLEELFMHQFIASLDQRAVNHDSYNVQVWAGHGTRFGVLRTLYRNKVTLCERRDTVDLNSVLLYDLAYNL